MITNPLNSQERTRVMDAIRQALLPIEPHLFQAEMAKEPGGLASIESHLDELVEIVRRSTAQRIEPYLAQMLDEVCSHCPQSQPSTFCPLRYEGKCVLFRRAAPIMKAIAWVLQEIRDPEYLARYPANATCEI